jgi:hypothetical protein
MDGPGVSDSAISARGEMTDGGWANLGGHALRSAVVLTCARSSVSAPSLACPPTTNPDDDTAHCTVLYCTVLYHTRLSSLLFPTRPAQPMPAMHACLPSELSQVDEWIVVVMAKTTRLPRYNA